MSSSYNFKDNLTIDNNKYLKWLNSSGTTRSNILSLDNSNNVNINSALGDFYINSNNSGSNTFLNTNNTSAVLVGSRLGIGFSSNSNISANLTIVKNGFIGLNTTGGTNNGYLGIAGSHNLSNTAGSRILLYGNNNTSGNAGSLQFYAGNASNGNIKMYTSNDSLKFTLNSTGSFEFTPDGTNIRLNITDSLSTFAHRLLITDTTNSTSSTTGALRIAGGIGITGNCTVDGTLSINSASGNINFNSTQPSNSYTSGSIFISGGLGISNTTSAISVTSGGGMSIAGGVSIAKNMFIGGNVVILDSSVPTSSQTGSLVLYGGLGLNSSIWSRTNTNPQIKLAPSSNGAQTNIAFYSTNNFSDTSTGGSSSWLVGQGVGTIGSGLFGIYSLQSGTIFTATYNNKVGISNTTPAYTLDIGGDINFTGNLTQNGLPYAGSGSSQWTTNGNDIFYTKGNVGIGTSSPSFTLDVSGGSRFISGVTTSTLSITGNTIEFISSITQSNINMPDTQVLRLGANEIIKPHILVVGNNFSSQPGRISARYSNYFSTDYIDGTVANIKMLLNSSGNLGIGTSNPEFTLDVIGGARITLGITTPNLFVTNISTTTLLATDITTSNILGTSFSGSTLNLSTGLTTNSLLASTTISSGLLNASNITSSNIVGTSFSGSTLNLSTGLTTGSLLASTTISTGLLNASNITSSNIVGTSFSGSTLNLSSSLTTGSVLATTRISSANVAVQNASIGSAVILNQTGTGITIASLNATNGITTGTLLATTTVSSGNLGVANATITSLNTTTITTGTLLVTNSTINFTSGSSQLNINFPDTRALRIGTDVVGKPHLLVVGNDFSGGDGTGGRVSARYSNYFSADYVNGTVANVMMLLNSSGNLGIGTTNPNFTLDVSGGARITLGITTPNLFVTNISTTTLLATNITSSNIVTTSFSSSTLNLSTGLTTDNLLASTSISTGLLNASNITSSNIVGTSFSGSTLNLSTGITTGTLLASTSISTGLLNAINITTSNIVGTSFSSSTLNLSTGITTGTLLAITRISSANLAVLNATIGSLNATNGITTSTLLASTRISSGNLSVNNATINSAIITNQNCSDITTGTLLVTNSVINFTSGSSQLNINFPDTRALRIGTDVVGKPHLLVVGNEFSGGDGSGGRVSARYSNYFSADYVNGTVANVMMLLNSSGNLGIGTTNPNFTLDVVGGARISLGITTPNLFVTDISTTTLLATNITSSNIVGTSFSGSTLNLSTGITTGTLLASTSISTGLLNASNITSSNIVGTSFSGSTLNLSTGITTGTLLASTSISTGLLNATNITTSNIVGTSFSSSTLNLSTGVTTGTLLSINGITTSTLLATTTVSSGNLGVANATITSLNTTTITTGTIMVTNTSINFTGGSTQLFINIPDSRAIRVGTDVVGKPHILVTGNDFSGGSGSGGRVSARYSNHFSMDYVDGTNATILALLNSSGSLGIGTTNPNFTLDVSGGARITLGITTGTILATDISSSNLGVANATINSAVITNQINTSITAGSLDITIGITSNNILVTNGNLIASFDCNTIGSIITTDGNVAIGNTSPSYKLHVTGDIYATGDITAFSDKRLKSDIKTIHNSLDLIEKLRGVYYTNISNNRPGIGVIAQEVQNVLPEVVLDKSEYMGVAYGNIVGLLIEGIKELNNKIKVLENNKV